MREKSESIEPSILAYPADSRIYVTSWRARRQARAALTAAMGVAAERRFEVLYGNSDSLFLRRDGATRGDYEDLAGEIAGRTGLPMALEHVFRYLVLLPQKGGAGVGAVNRYYGITTAGELECRGVELRRRDTPPFVARVQKEVMEALLTCSSREEVLTVGLERASEIVDKACRQIEEGDVLVEDLRISNALSREVGEYVSHGGHVTAANALRMNRFRVGSGDLVDYLYVDAGNANPFRRVRPVSFGEARPDTVKYQKLVMQAVETVLNGLE